MATRPGVAYLGIYEHRLVDGDGHITQPWYDALQALNARSNSSGDVSAVGDLTLNRLIVGNGGQDIRAEALNDGQIPIGATSDGTVIPATITEGANISVTNGAHSITIAATGVVTGPAGANTDIQYNDSGVFGGDANLTWDKTTRQARAIGSLASPIRASVGSSGGGEIGLSPFSAAGNDLTLGAYADAAQDWIPSGTDLLDLFQRSSAHQDGGFEVAYGLTAGVPDPFTAAVGVHIVTPTDTSGDPIDALEVYQYGGLGTGAKPGLLIIANRNDSGAGAASTLGGEQRGGTRWFIWQDATGAMRYGPARPTEDNSVSDTSGTQIGTGDGTVTHTAGALTANELLVGNGSADIKTVAATDGQIPIGKSSDGSVTLATLTAGANITITNAGGSITIAASGGSSTGGSTLIGLDRLLGDGSTTTFNLADLAEYVVDVSDAGSTVDPTLYSLSADLSQIIFGTAPTAGHVLTFEYVVAQLAA